MPVTKEHAEVISVGHPRDICLRSERTSVHALNVRFGPKSGQTVSRQKPAMSAIVREGFETSRTKVILLSHAFALLLIGSIDISSLSLTKNKT
jgi:hypothetical protein